MPSSFDRRALLSRLVAVAVPLLLPADRPMAPTGRMIVRGTSEAAALNRSGAIIWLGLVRGLPEREIAAAISRESGETEEQALETVRRFGRELVGRRILDE